jgi:hypothetical protein
MRGRGKHQRPQHGHDPRHAAASTSDAAAAQQAAAAAAGMNPYAYAPNPHQYAQNAYNLMLPHLFLQNQAALAAAYQQQHLYHQRPLLPSPGYAQPPTANAPHRPSKPAPQPEAPASAPPPRNQRAVLEKAQAAARKARDELARSGQAVTGWKVAQAALLALKADSWGSLGVQLHDVPVLRDLFLIEGKVSTCLPDSAVVLIRLVTVHSSYMFCSELTTTVYSSAIAEPRVC